MGAVGWEKAPPACYALHRGYAGERPLPCCERPVWRKLLVGVRSDSVPNRLAYRATREHSVLCPTPFSTGAIGGSVKGPTCTTEKENKIVQRPYSAAWRRGGAVLAGRGVGRERGGTHDSTREV